MSEIYYKTPKDSKYGKEFQKLIDKGKSVEKQILEYMEELGAEPEYLKSGHCVFHTGLVAAKFIDEPDMKIWKRVRDFPNHYQPRNNSKIGKELNAKFDSFDKIEREKIGSVFGWDSFMNRPGFGVGKDVFLVALDAEWKHPMPEEFTEITYSEYSRLSS